jgi:opacity protein-like surface antigen
MRWSKSTLVVAAVLTVTFATSALAQPPMGIPQEAKKEPTPGLWRKTIVGGQLGPWFVNELGNDISTPSVRLDASGTAFHLEFFYQPNMIGILNLDFSVGAINRGDLRIRGVDYDAFGNATLYPLSAGIILYPMAKRAQQQFQPLVKAGGSVVVGTEVIEVTTVDYYGYGIDTQSRTTLGYYFGAGANFVFSPSFALTGMVKYQHAKFDEELFEARDYSGTQVLFGAAYMYR